MRYLHIQILLGFILAIQCYGSNTNGFQSMQDFVRWKRQNSQWIWGNVGNQQGPNTGQSRTSTAAPVSSTPHVCDPFVPPETPDFTRGRRISDAKCLEYIWQMKIRNDNETHDAECIKWRSQFFGRRFVIGGRDTAPTEFPHMAALGWRAVVGDLVFKCGGSLISQNFVLTAAHCSKTSRDAGIRDQSPEIVRLGDKNIINVSTDVVTFLDAKISRIIVHPQYKAPRKYYDIALVELAQSVTFTKHIQPACLWSQLDTSSLGSQATVTGWGLTNSAKRTRAPELQVGEVDLIDSNTCEALLESFQSRVFNGLQTHQICAGKLAGGVDTCQGDSGGPLQVKIAIPITTQGSLHRLVGVTSFGFQCARENMPGVYTRVASFIDWIEKVVWGKYNFASLFQR